MAAFSSLQNFVVGWGIPKQLRLDLLPTGAGLVDHFFFLEHTMQPSMSKRDMRKSICRSITDLWMEAGATPIGSSGVEKKVHKLFKDIRSFKKTPSWKRDRKKFPRVNDLFEICSCTCILSSNYKNLVDASGCNCKCQLSGQTIQFIKDQRCQRHMRLKNGGFFDIGHAIAVVTTNDIFRNIHANQRNMDKTSVTEGSESNQDTDEAFDTALEDLFTNELNDVLNSQDDQDEDDSETLGHPEKAEDENSDDDFEVENDGGSEFFLPHETSDEDDVEIFQSKNFLRYPNLYLAASRFGVSNSAAACIANATLIDLGNLTEPLRLDHNKIGRGER